MAKIDPLDDVGSLANTTSARAVINNNSQKIEDAFANTLSRDGSAPNQMEADFDLNDHYLLNVADPINEADGVNLRSVRPLVEQFASEIVETAVFGTQVVDPFVASAAQTDFPLSQPPGSIENVSVFVNGVALEPNTEFTLTGASLQTLVVTSPMAGGESVVIRYTKALPSGIELAQNVTYTPPSTGLAGTVRSFLDSLWDTDGSGLIRHVQTGAGATLRTVQDKLRERVSVFDFMSAAQIADVRAGTNAVDVTAAIQAAVNAHSHVVCPAGRYLISAPITIPEGNTLMGEGERDTVFVRSGSDMSFIVLGGRGAELHNLRFGRTGATVATTGRVIDCSSQSDCRLSDIWVEHCWDGVYIRNVAGLSMERMYINGWQNAGIHVNGLTNDVFLQDFILNNMGSNQGTGIRLFDKVEAFIAVNGDVIGGNFGMTTGAAGVFDPDLRANPNFNKLTNVYFDSSVSGVSVDKAALLTFDSCWFATAALSSGCTVQDAQDITFESCEFVNNGSHGCIATTSTAVRLRWRGCKFQNNNELNNSSNGLTIFGGISSFAVESCDMNNGLFTPSPGQVYGLLIAAGASNNYIITGNNFNGNVTGAVSNGATGATYKISGNLGYETPVRVPTLAGTWANAGGAWKAAGYWKDDDGVVHLQGMVTGGAAALITTLPVGYRPTGDLRIPGVANNAFASLEVKANGDVNLTTAIVANVSLDGVNFRTA